MLERVFAPKLLALYVYVASTLYVQLRGKDRLVWRRQLTDHSTFVAPYNALIYLFSGVPNQPVYDENDFPALAPLRENWETIRDEARRLYEGGHIQAAENYNDLAFNTFFKQGWKRFYLKWYDDVLPSARALCPKTVALVRSIPEINAALFVSLAPRSRLGVHRDPFAGSLRYHLGLMTPNSDDCRILIDGEPHSWRDGQGLLFDETYVHSVDNDTDQPRIILFCDVARPIRNPLVRALNEFTTRHIVKVTATQNLPTEEVGLLNHVSGVVYALKTFFTRLKQANRRLYYVGKNALYLFLAYQFIVARILRARRRQDS